MNPETHTCDCGYTWRHGLSGAHSCGQYYRQTIAELRAAAAPQVVADERAAFDIWWADFADTHEEWPFADSGALRWAAYQAGRAAVPVQAQEPVRQTINPMGEDGNQWYFDCDGHYIDVKKDADGKYSIFFRDRSNGEEAWLDQADHASVQPVAVLDSWPTAEMVVRGAEQLHDCLRSSGVEHDFDANLRGTEIQQDIAESVFKSMIELAAPAAQGDAKEEIEKLLKSSQLHSILQKVDDARNTDDFGKRARAAFEELCEWIYEYRIDAAIAAKAAS